MRSAAFSDTKTGVQSPLSGLLHGAYSTACASCLHLHFLWQFGGRPHAHACVMSSHACSGAHRTAGASCLLLHALCQFGRQPRLQRHRPTGAKSQAATRQVAIRKAQGPGPTLGKSHVGTHKGFKNEDPKRRPQGGTKAGRKSRVTARCVIQKTDVVWCHGAVPLLGPAKRPSGAPIIEHLAAANAAVGTAAEPSPAPVGTAQAQPSSRRHSSRAQPSTAQPSSPAQSSDLEAPCQVILHVHVQSPRASRRTHACAHLCKCRAGVTH